MEKTKVIQILEYIRDNQPCRAVDICEAVLQRRQMPATGSLYSMRAYSYFPGWSGFRVYLTQNWGWDQNPKKALIKLTKLGYILTKLGQKKMERENNGYH